jgi:hypothetical protein
MKKVVASKEKMGGEHDHGKDPSVSQVEII